MFKKVFYKQRSFVYVCSTVCALNRLKRKVYRNYNFQLANDWDAIEEAVNRYETERYWLFAFKKHSQGPDNGLTECLLDVVETHVAVDTVSTHLQNLNNM